TLEIVRVAGGVPLLEFLFDSRAVPGVEERTPRRRIRAQVVDIDAGNPLERRVEVQDTFGAGVVDLEDRPVVFCEQLEALVERRESGCQAPPIPQAEPGS